MSDTQKWIGGVTGAIVLVGMMLWGVPYYIRAEAQDTFTAEVKAAALAGPSQDIQDLTAELALVNGRLTALEAEVKMIGEDTRFVRDKFVGFLERQAERNR